MLVLFLCIFLLLLFLFKFATAYGIFTHFFNLFLFIIFWMLIVVLIHLLGDFTLMSKKKPKHQLIEDKVEFLMLLLLIP